MVNYLTLKVQIKKWFVDEGIILLFSILIPIAAMIMNGGMLIQLKSTEGKILIDFFQIALTLFGFTLISSIFEGRKMEGKPLVIKRMFFLSIIFLSAAIGFFILNSLISLKLSIGFWGIILVIILMLSFTGLTYGLLYLLKFLILHYKDMK